MAVEPTRGGGNPTVPFARQIYFLGIGGIGMSALARYFHRAGCEVAGYDKTPSPLTDALEAEGMAVTTDERVEALPDWDWRAEGVAVVWTPAIPGGHLQRVWFENQGIRCWKRSEVLGRITQAKPTLAVAGTHGKTTTSSLLAHLLEGTPGGCDAFLGGIAAAHRSNLYLGSDPRWTVVEADEFDRSFLQLRPTHAVITSVDPDHLDIYGDPSAFEAGFRDFAGQVAGRLLVHERVAGDWHSTSGPAERYGVSAGQAPELRHAAVGHRVVDGVSHFDLRFDGATVLPAATFPLPGVHNLENAVAACTLALIAGAAPETLRPRLAQFPGVYRRFQYILRTQRVVFIDDYAHHPVELERTIEAARAAHPGRHLTGIFQPHLFTRTRDHLAGFARALDRLDRAILLPIYPAREAPISGIDSQRLFDNMQLPDREICTPHQIFECLERRPVDVLLTLGAGDIDRLVEPIANQLIKSI
jgi:UDP-N-acetylmuramate--alanine ligase